MSTNRNITEQSLTLWKSAILEKDDWKISNLKTWTKPFKSNPMLKQAKIIYYLEKRWGKNVHVAINKASKNVTIICKTYYVEVTLR